MNALDLKNLLEDAEDKFAIFSDRNTLIKYNCNFAELLSLISDFLTDEQKKALFDLEHFKRFPPSIRAAIIQTINNHEYRAELIENPDVASDFNEYNVIKMVESLDDNAKIRILYNQEFRKKYNMGKNKVRQLIASLSEVNKQEVLRDTEFSQENLENWQIREIIKELKEEKDKLEMLELYDFKDWQIEEILETFTDESKIAIVLENKYGFKNADLISLISSFSIDSLLVFLKDNQEYLEKKGIKPHKITRRLNKEKQEELVSRFEEVDLELNEKRKILVTLRDEVKTSIDTSCMPTEYISAIKMQTSTDMRSYGNIIVDLNGDLEMYSGLDEFVFINAMELLEEDKPKLLKLCEICSEMSIEDNLGLASSTVEEYRSGEDWIKSVLEGINPEWSSIQKVAFIDYSIGKKVSYTPDFDTEVFDVGGARALWKILHSGYGVCNGIAQVEKYILDKVGIEVEIVSSGSHSFLKLKNIQIPTENGDIIQGDTILDPTWNLTAHRYGCKPENFCRSYEEIRKHDIRDDGADVRCHKNDEALASATLDLDEQSLRRIFTSIGVAGKEGNFPIGDLMDKSMMIDAENFPEEESIKRQFSLLAEYCPEFATCQNSTMSILQGVLLNHENLNFNKCVVNRVYAREDEDKRPRMYVYVDFPNAGKKFYIAEKEAFVELSQMEFEAKFECYEMDMEKQDGRRPWEVPNRTQKVEDLTRSSGKIIAEEGDGR